MLEAGREVKIKYEQDGNGGAPEIGGVAPAWYVVLSEKEVGAGLPAMMEVSGGIPDAGVMVTGGAVVVVELAEAGDAAEFEDAEDPEDAEEYVVEVVVTVTVSGASCALVGLLVVSVDEDRDELVGEVVLACVVVVELSEPRFIARGLRTYASSWRPEMNGKKQRVVSNRDAFIVRGGSFALTGRPL